MPSYRPQAKTSRGSAAYSAARAWVNGMPAGVGTISRARSPGPTIASSAWPQGSGFITMPGPPPNGASSTVWCTSLVQARRSWTLSVMSPRWTALPMSDSFKAVKYPPKMVTMSMRRVAS